jgi:hypothetical protein
VDDDAFGLPDPEHHEEGNDRGNFVSDKHAHVLYACAIHTGFLS